MFIFKICGQKGKFSFSKNRIVNKQLEFKSIPSLEIHAISLGTEVLLDTFKELAGNECVEPIKILELEIYTDSLVCLNWLNSKINKLDKLRNLSVFVINRLNSICRLCEVFPVKYKFCAGAENPADCISRPLSYNQLLKSNYFSGPDF